MLKSVLLTTLVLLLIYSPRTTGQIYLELEAKTDLSFQEIVAQTEAYFDLVGREKGKGYKPFRRWQYEAQSSLNPDGTIRPAREDLERYRKFSSSQGQQKSASGHFIELGPSSATNTTTWSSALGRFSAIGLDRNDPNHVLAGSPTGGIWRTVDGGQTWTPLYDFALDTDIWSLEISHSNRNHYWAGTGSEILYSTDGGYSWQAASSGPTNNQVNTIVMDPMNASVLLATDRFGEKIWRSSDGGVNWNSVHTPGNDTYDIEFQPGNSSVVYSSGKGFIAKSTDNGQSWVNLSGPWSTGVIMLAVTDDAPAYVYALQETSGGYQATYLSTDEGASWNIQSDNSSGTNNILTYNQSSSGGQAPRDMDICVSPTDRMKVYVAGTELWYSDNAGESFVKIADWLVNSALPFIHADVDLLYYTNNGFYAGTDGGLFVSTDNGTSWTDWTTGTSVRQFYRIGVSETDIDRVSGGSQDNGTGVLRNGNWYDWVGADGMETLIDWSDEDVIYTNIQFGGLYKSIDGGNTFAPIAQTPGDGAWVSPLEQDPVDPNTLYHGVEEIYKSTDGGASWNTITSFGFSSDCREIEVSPANNQVIYASWGSVMYKTEDGGVNWTEISPGGHINYIDSHPADPDRVAVAQSGTIKESVDGGVSWTEIKENLPGITYYCVLYANDGQDGMFLGGRPGVWFRDNTSNSQWSDVSLNLPTTQVRELEIRNNTLYVATYGRGLWKASLGPLEGFDCDSAIDITEAGSYIAPGPSFGNGCHNCVSSTHANWFSYTAPEDGQLSVYSCHANVDTRLFIYTGTCSNLTEIANSDDDCPLNYNSTNNYASEVTNVSLSKGTSVFIEWDDRWSSKSFFWTLEFCVDDYSGTNKLTGILDNSADYETDGIIDSDQHISGTNLNVIYDSGQQINLLPGFNLNLGNVFKIVIDGCGGPE